jgi:predicted enzyme related to lactoylglutathione lyase
MLQITEIAFTGYPVTDVARARRFYESVLGLAASLAHEIEPGMWWVEYEIGGHSLAITNAWAPSGQGGPTVALEVSDLDAALTVLRGAGVAITYGPLETPVCRLFGVADPDGNGITFHQRKH